MSELGPSPAGRWTAQRKGDLCEAIRRRRLTREAAIAAHGLSAEELDEWLARHARAGVPALKITRLQELRR